MEKEIELKGNATLNFSIQDNFNIMFQNEKGDVVGKVFIENDVMKFEGEAEESAKVFFDHVVKQYLTKKHSLHGKRVTWSMNGFDGVGIVVDVEDDIAHIAVIDSHSTFQTYANLPIEILH